MSKSIQQQTIGHWITELPKRKQGIAIRYKSNNKWLELSWLDYYNSILSTAKLLSELLITKNYKKHTHIGIMSNTRWEWAAIDLAILGLGLVTVPIYPNISDEDIVFIVNHSEIEILFVENLKLKKQIDNLKKNFIRKIDVLVIDSLKLKRKFLKKDEHAFIKSCKKVKPTDVATIVYTSGTTGAPKGAVLKHEAIVSEVVESFSLFQVTNQDSTLCFLPFSHVLGRIEHWGSCYVGYTIAYAESIESLRRDLKEVKPQFIMAVPRVFEKVYASIQAKLETQFIFGQVFQQAISVSEKVKFYRETKQMIPWLLLVQFETLSKLVFTPIQAALGGNLKFAISGGAPLNPQIAKFFASCGINILEGYGLTETCAAITVNTLNDNIPGTVGRPIGDVHIKIAEDGEILVKSKKCFSEYYKDPESTKQAFEDGYFKTGDIGKINSCGHLIITDRKKELIKTSGGKYIIPRKLEDLLKLDPLISQVLIIGDRQKFVTVLLSLDKPLLDNWAKSTNLQFESMKDLVHNPNLRLRLQKTIQQVNSHLPSFETIKKFEIVSEPWTVENNLLTPSMKVKRKPIEEKYKELIEEMYD